MPLHDMKLRIYTRFRNDTTMPDDIDELEPLVSELDSQVKSEDERDVNDQGSDPMKGYDIFLLVSFTQ